MLKTMITKKWPKPWKYVVLGSKSDHKMGWFWDHVCDTVKGTCNVNMLNKWVTEVMSKRGHLKWSKYHYFDQKGGPILGK